MLCIHGYGVRGFFWEQFKKQAGIAGFDVRAADLKLAGVESAIEEVAALARDFSAEKKSPIVLVGHSLGGILSALAAKNLDASVLAALVVISSPFGEKKNDLPPLVRFLLWRGLLPGWLVRPKFFGPDVPVKIQKDLFAKAVKEEQTVQEAAASKTWFHTDAFPNTLPMKSLVIASELDHIVPFYETLNFAKALGAETHVFAASERVGHDDVGVDPRVADLVLKKIRPLATR